MFRIGLTYVAFVMIALNTSMVEQTGAVEKFAATPGGPFMRVFGEALPPLGHVGFCQRHPRDCRAEPTLHEQVALGDDSRRQLQDVNDLVNRMVRPATDQELYGLLEYWNYPAGKGDCEDYVLLKQRILSERGWPKSALLITVVRDENGEGHAVLTVRTSDGDLILDNKRDEVMAWSSSPYAFVKRQSATDPRIWLSLAQPSDGGAAQVSGTKHK